MKTRTFTFTAVAALAALLIFSGSGLAARKTCDDGSFPPCADTGSGMEPPDYGDLIILYRDIDGVPIPSPETTAMDPDGLPAPADCVGSPSRLMFRRPEVVPSGLRGRQRTRRHRYSVVLLTSTSTTVVSRRVARAARRRSTSAASTRCARRMMCLTGSCRTSSST